MKLYEVLFLAIHANRKKYNRSNFADAKNTLSLYSMSPEFLKYAQFLKYKYIVNIIQQLVRKKIKIKNHTAIRIGGAETFPLYP